MLEIKLDNQPADFLKKCDKTLFIRIKKKLENLKFHPVPLNAKRVINKDHIVFRIKIGKYRILYRLNVDEFRIVIIKIDHRGICLPKITKNPSKNPKQNLYNP